MLIRIPIKMLVPILILNSKYLKCEILNTNTHTNTTTNANTDTNTKY